MILGKKVLAGYQSVAFEVDDVDKYQPSIALLSKKYDHKRWICTFYVSTSAFNPLTMQEYNKYDWETMSFLNNNPYKKQRHRYGWYSPSMRAFRDKQ